MDCSFTPEQMLFKEAVGHFAKKELEPLVREMEATDRFPVKAFKKLGELGYLGVHFPSESGGADADFISFCIVIEEVCYVLCRHRRQRAASQPHGERPYLSCGKRRTEATVLLAGDARREDRGRGTHRAQRGLERR